MLPCGTAVIAILSRDNMLFWWSVCFRWLGDVKFQDRRENLSIYNGSSRAASAFVEWSTFPKAAITLDQLQGAQSMDFLNSDIQTIFPFIRESEVLEHTIDVNVIMGGDSRHVRIEVLRLHNGGGYSTRTYVETDIEAPMPLPPHGSARSWCVMDMPWTHANNAEQALRSALSSLRGRCDKGS